MSTTVTLTRERELACGVLVEFEASYELGYVDNGFDHEFGTEHCWEWEIEECSSFAPIESIRYYVEQSIPRQGRRKQWRKRRALARKQAAAEIAKLSDEEVFDTDDIIDAAPTEPDFDIPDDDDGWEPEDRHIDLAYEDRYADMDY